MNYADILWHDTINGFGLRVSIFFSGCTIKCPGCFNEKYQDFNFGKPFTKELQEKIIETVNDPKFGYSGISLLGGEPLDSAEDLSDFISECKFKLNPDKNIWLWSGRTLDYIKHKRQGTNSFDVKNVTDFVEYMVLGPYVESQRNLTLKFRGSNNQRIYRKFEDVTELIDSGKLII